MKFTVNAVSESEYKDRTGDEVPDEVELKSLADLVAWTDRVGGKIVVMSRNDIRDEPHITVYNDWLE